MPGKHASALCPRTALLFSGRRQGVHATSFQLSLEVVNGAHGNCVARCTGAAEAQASATASARTKTNDPHSHVQALHHWRRQQTRVPPLATPPSSHSSLRLHQPQPEAIRAATIATPPVITPSAPTTWQRAARWQASSRTLVAAPVPPLATPRPTTAATAQAPAPLRAVTAHHQLSHSSPPTVPQATTN